jgi:murein L,D-transpeptidase YcbB/YkuD
MIPVKLIFRLLSLMILLVPFRLNAQIRLAFKKEQGNLYYPQSVERFYQQNGYKLAWIAPDTVKTHAWDAMLLLDCVRQYGLNHEDYHPNLLLYPKLDQLTKQGKHNMQTAVFDILLTDAMIRFINDLHYGKLNLVYTSQKIDKGTRFKADKALLLALQSNDFLSAIDNVQPKSKLYIDLQDHMRLLIGQRSGDCYVIPQGLIRKMAINMERLRWINTTGRKVHLTIIVREGLVIYYKDVYKQDRGLERALYNEGKVSNSYFKFNQFTPDKL